MVRRSRKKKAAIAVSGAVLNKVGTGYVDFSNNGTEGVQELNASAAAAVDKVELKTFDVSDNDLQNSDMSFSDGNRRMYASAVAACENIPPPYQELAIDLNGMSLEEGIPYVKDHLTYCVCCGDVHELRILIEDGSYKTELWNLKRAIIRLLLDEGFTWEREGQVSLLITFDGRKELKFMKEGRISGCRVLVV